MKVLFMIVLTLLSVNVPANNISRSARQVIKVGLYENPPKIFTDQQGKAVGFWPEIIENIAKKEGWSIKWVKVTWHDGIKKLQNAEIDIMPDTGWTVAREKKFIFSKEVVITSWSRLYIPQNSTVKTIVDLNGKTIAGLRGGINLEGPEGIKDMVKNFGLQIKVIGMDSYNEVFRALENNEIAGGITNKDFGNLYEGDYKIKRTAIIFQPAHMQFAFSRLGVVNQAMVNKIDQDIKALKIDKNSIFYRAYNHYIAGNEATKTKEVIPPWLMKSFEIALLAILFFIILWVTTRIQVKKRTRELLKSEQKFRTLTNSSPVGMFLINSQGMAVHLNKRCAELIGLSVKDSENDGWMKNLHPDEKESLLKQAKQAVESNGIFQKEFRWVHQDGSIVWTLGKINRVEGFEQEEQPLIGTLIDITEKKLAEEEIHKLGAAIEQSPGMIVITNLKVEIEYVNPAFLQVTGYEKSEVIGKNPSMFQSTKTTPETYKNLWETLLSGKDWAGEFINTKKNGSEYHEYAHISPLRQADGKVTHYVAIKEDVTEKNLIALELEEHRYHLEKIVASRTEELALARVKAEEASLAKSNFLANMSHEIRTPMNAIVGLTHILKRLNLDTIQIDKLNKIDSSAKHLLSVINDILDISKIEAGKLNLEQNNFHLDAIFDHVISILNDQINRKGLTIIVDKNAVPKWLIGDSTRIKQALLNLASNAVKFTEEGVIYLRCKKLKLVQNRVFVRFEVEDTGIGIEPDKIEDLFNSFQQADTTIMRKYGGTGLGLGITRHLANLMGGECGAESELDKGSTFWFTAWLDCGQTDQKRIKDNMHSNVEIALKKYQDMKILLVEDNAINREVATDLLHSVNLQVDVAENGLIALEKLAEQRFDLILMDLQMPEMDGLEATKQIRKKWQADELPILAMTANIFLEDRLSCLNVGMNDFVAKPVDPLNLFKSLLKWLPNKEDPQPLKKGNSTQTIQNKLPPSDERTLLTKINGLDLDIVSRNLAGKLDGLLALINKLARQLESDIEALYEAFDAKNSTKCLEIIHTLKGTVGTLGLVKIQHKVMLIDNMLRDDKMNSALKTQIKALAKLQKKLSQDLQQIALKTNSRTTKATTFHEDSEILQRLSKYLEQDSAKANDLILENKENLKHSFGDIIETLAAQIEQYNYPEAISTLEEVQNRFSGKTS